MRKDSIDQKDEQRPRSYQKYFPSESSTLFQIIESIPITVYKLTWNTINISSRIYYYLLRLGISQRHEN